MNRETLWERYAALPSGAQRQVDDLIAFLGRRRITPSAEAAPPESKLSDEAAIGMWRDRPDLSESGAWVRALRRREWERA